MTTDIELTIKDIAAVKDIIELASRRGAFQADELTSVGTTYDRIVQFINHIVARAQAAEQAQQGVPAND